MTRGETVALNEGNLKQLPAGVQVPTYDRSAVMPSIVHIGVGGFFRAHQAVYLDDLLHRPGNEEWGYCGVSLLPHDARMRDVLHAQDCLYTLLERSVEADRPRVVGSLLQYLFAPGDPDAVLEKIASPETRIVSLTITEGGYYVNKVTGEFNASHPDIVRDLADPEHPTCSFGVLAEAQARRRVRGLDPFIVMSCDNLEHNGEVARRTLLAYAELRDPALATWLADTCAFPSSMVDRITPATTDQHRALVREQVGVADGWPVMTEPFTQWVIEDSFPSGRPPWEEVGAQMTSDVVPYEKMKMRLLNASHQAMCYIGMLLGHEFAHEAWGDERIGRLCERMMDEEVTPLLVAPEGINLKLYKATLGERFSNPTIRDQLSRIGTEGSTRIPGFVLPSIGEAIERGGQMRFLAFTVAAWFRYLTGEDDAGRAMPINDPVSKELQERARRGGRDPDALLGMRALFGEALLASPIFVDAVRETLASFYDKGAQATLEAALGG